jgi:hypothetical protein
MIINAGLNRVITSAQDKIFLTTFDVEDWVKEWQKRDIIEDKYQYGKHNG